jgi:multicomponent Na+:H+ antiporter subunit A
MFVLLFAHFIVAAVALTVLKSRPRVSAFLGIGVFIATIIAMVQWGRTPEGAGEAVRNVSVTWIGDLGLSLSLRLDSFAVMMVLIISVLGALVLAYSVAYFDPDDTTARFTGFFIAFAGVMSGLVMSADLFTMFVFWELTSVLSFLLIGLHSESGQARASALRALLVTGAGGLCLLAGVALFQVELGTTSFQELANMAPTGTVITVAAILVLLGAFTKSAQFPFHFWLPGAMAAPTPVSAYLHSATMVKAGIVLMARMSPIFGDLDIWRWMVVLAGGITMVLGGVRAMYATDAKLLLAHSTVSQLGFLGILAGIGIPGATYAAVVHLAAHAVFKAALFLSVGAVDHAVGSRDIRTLSGVGRQMPLVATLATLSAASMAGVIPLFGFATKEKALAVLLKADDTVGAVGNVALAFVVVGAVLSTAYSVRFVRGVFGTKKDCAPSHVHHAPSFLLVAPVVLLSGASLLAGLFAKQTGHLFDAVATTLSPTASGKLALWPGVNTALVVSVIVVAVGAVIGSLVPFAVTARSLPVTGDKVYLWLLVGILSGSKKITKYTQNGSLQTYVVVTMSVLIATLVYSLATDQWPHFDNVVIADSPLQLGVVVLGIVLTGVVTFTAHRFVAALLLGGVGFAIAVVFALFGAPDLALTQILVETIVLVVFLLVLRQLPSKFERSVKGSVRVVQIGLSVSVGLVVALFALLVGNARLAPSVGEEYIARSAPQGGGNNVVNVILVDFRGVDTLGEITVLAVAAIGVANLVNMARRQRRAATAEVSQ